LHANHGVSYLIIAKIAGFVINHGKKSSHISGQNAFNNKSNTLNQELSAHFKFTPY
jgi:hypothetical protein